MCIHGEAKGRLWMPPHSVGSLTQGAQNLHKHSEAHTPRRPASYGKCDMEGCLPPRTSLESRLVCRSCGKPGLGPRPKSAWTPTTREFCFSLYLTQVQQVVPLWGALRKGYLESPHSWAWAWQCAFCGICQHMCACLLCYVTGAQGRRAVPQESAWPGVIFLLRGKNRYSDGMEEA